MIRKFLHFTLKMKIMFIGHYASAFALKGAVPKTSLGMLFVATQFVDILFFPFVNLGIERLKIVPHYTASTHFDLEYYPFTHGLLATVLWSLLFYWVYRYLVNNGKSFSKQVAWAMGLAVLSHWFADLIVHTHDLPLLGDHSPKMGFGLWNYRHLTFATEVSLLVLGLMYYLRKTKGHSFWGKYGAILFTGFMIFAGYLNLYILPPPENTMALMISALVSYGIFSVLAAFVDKARHANS